MFSIVVSSLEFATWLMEGAELIPQHLFLLSAARDQLSLVCAFGPVSLQLGPIRQAKARNGL